MAAGVRRFKAVGDGRRRGKRPAAGIRVSLGRHEMTGGVGKHAGVFGEGRTGQSCFGIGKRILSFRASSDLWQD